MEVEANRFPNRCGELNYVEAELCRSGIMWELNYAGAELCGRACTEDDTQRRLLETGERSLV